MGADYCIECRTCKEEVSEFGITRNYNKMFPFWMFHKQDFYKQPAKYLKIILISLQYYGYKGESADYWILKMKSLPEHHTFNGKGWETNKYTVILALLRLKNNICKYWNTKKYKWSCWY